MKIALFSDTFFPDVNGVAKTLHRWTNYLDKNRIEYQVFAPKSSMKQENYAENIHSFLSLPLFLYPECRIALPNILHIKEELQRFKPDLIHVATPFNVGLCGLHLAKKLHIPIVGSYHTDFDTYLDFYQLNFLKVMLWKYMRWFHRPLQKIFVPSTDTQINLTKKGFKNVSIWSRGVDCSLFHTNYNHELIRKKYNIHAKHLLVYAGRIAPEKDVLLLPAINNMLPDPLKKETHWLIVGDGPLKPKLEANNPGNMTFTGFLTSEELAPIYTAADLFVFPSPSETFGNVVLESFASGTPVIGANAGGVRTIIESDSNGLLCTEKSTHQFANAIKQLLHNNLKRQVMATNARHYALSQSWDTVFDNLLLEYKKTIQSNAIQRLA